MSIPLSNHRSIRMRAGKYLLATFLITSFSCQPASNSPSEQEVVVSEANKEAVGLPAGSHRYCFVTNDDTALLTVHVGKDGVVAGTYMHQFSGKDRNDGDLENAYFKGDTLIADYRYWSEGVRSLREIRFVIRNGRAQEGYGELKGEGEKLIYQNPAKLFYGGPLLSTATCGGNVDKIK